MALANTADILARAGLRVLMIDFDLEAPGLEQFFPVDHKSIRAEAGLFDLILRYKVAMASSVPTEPGEQDFRKLQDLFVVPIYHRLPSGGKLDLMPAGRRGNDEQLSEYALGLRQFDWQEFYFNFGGEVFFEWLRRSLDRNLYDVVLVDSRTGVTEMGGICAYQLADIIIVMCASNQQNLDGTHDVVRNFFSPRVTMLRAGRKLKLLVVPSRVEMRDEKLLGEVRDRFEKVFGIFTPEELTDAGLTYWDLMIPYEPRSAFQERVVVQGSRAGTRSAINPAMQKLVRALGLIAGPAEAIHRVVSASGPDAARTAEAQYDVTSRGAGFDIFLAYSRPDAEAVEIIARFLRQKGLRAFTYDQQELSAGEDFTAVERRALDQCGACAVIVGPSADYPWRSEYLRRLLEDKHRATGLRFLPVLLPGAVLPTSDLVPPFLSGLHWLRLSELESDSELYRLVENISSGSEQAHAKTDRLSSVPPYKGLDSYGEADASIFFGREDLVHHIIQNLEDSRFLAVIGPSGVGKTSVVCAGVIPALRRGAIPGSERWHCVVMRPGDNPTRGLFEALIADSPDVAPISSYGATVSVELSRYLEGSDDCYLLVIDQFEELFTISQFKAGELDTFIQILLDIATHWKRRVSLIIVLRSDYLSRLLELSPSWATLVEENIAFVGPMSAAALRRAVEAPAHSAGLAIEAGLTDLILRDAAGAVGALPLLQYILRALWERRQQGYLTVEAYQFLGGLAGSLARDADAFFHTLSPGDNEKAMALLLRLVAVGPDGAFVKKVATVDELVFASSPEDIRRILNYLVNSRMVVVSSDGFQTRVELAHEAIITAWPRFRDQIEQMSQFLRLRTRLGMAATRWQEANKRGDFLYPEGEVRLLKSQELFDHHLTELSPLEREFLEVSMNAQRTRQRARFAVLASLVILSLLTASLAIFSWKKAEYANKQYMMATEAQFARTKEAEFARLATLGALSVVSPDGTRMLRVDPSGTLSLIDIKTGLKVELIAAPSEAVSTAEFSPYGRLLAIGTNSGRVLIYDSETKSEKMSFMGHESAIRRLAFSPDGRLLASGSDDARARIWSLDEGSLAVITADSPVIGIAFSPDGSRLVVTSEAGGVYIADPKTGRFIRQ
jgi:hypothetical protein